MPQDRLVVLGWRKEPRLARCTHQVIGQFVGKLLDPVHVLRLAREVGRFIWIIFQVVQLSQGLSSGSFEGVAVPAPCAPVQ